MQCNWEKEIADLLTELSQAQDDLLSLLADKRRVLAASDGLALAAMQPREEALLERLKKCHEHRGELLATAAAEGLPAASVRSLAAALPRHEAIDQSMDRTSARCRLLQHESLTNWVLAQRTLLHLSQMLEIIATGGRPRPTYEKGTPSAATGALVDRAA